MICDEYEKGMCFIVVVVAVVLVMKPEQFHYDSYEILMSVF